MVRIYFSREVCMKKITTFFIANMAFAPQNAIESLVKNITTDLPLLADKFEDLSSHISYYTDDSSDILLYRYKATTQLNKYFAELYPEHQL